MSRAATWRDRVVVADHDRDDRRAQEPSSRTAEPTIAWSAPTKSMRSSSLARHLEAELMHLVVGNDASSQRATRSRRRA